MAEIEILIEVLTSESSKLYKILDDKKLINQSFDSEYFNGQGYNCVILSGECREPKALCEEVKAYIAELKRSGIDSEDFEIAKREVYGDAVSSLNSVDNIANTMAEFHFSGYDIFGIIDDIAACTLDDVNARLMKMFDVDNCTLSVVLPKE